MKKYLLILSAAAFSASVAGAVHRPGFSTAGFNSLPDTGREAYSMNIAWRFYKGDQGSDRAADLSYDDRQWPVVSLPHGIEYLPKEASGGVNYQGVVWYRKHFAPDEELKGKKLFLHFEAVMGKCKVWVNGVLVKEHFGGYLPVIADISQHLKWDGENVIAVMADNSDDPSFPPGKPQNSLDFTYFGGIYRDCWLIAHNDVYITDPNYENTVAGGGLLVWYDNVSERSASVNLELDVCNERKGAFAGTVEYLLVGKDGRTIKKASAKLNVRPGATGRVSSAIKVDSPELWSPGSPSLYTLQVRVKDGAGKVVDGYSRRIGIRSIEFRGEEGFRLNGKPYGKPLVGANRHQDFAVLGNAMPNTLHWYDAKKLRDAGLEVIRSAHYPQDPAFMDACDELGLFVIVATPGWQFWGDSRFEERVYSDIRNMVRRDRNHPSVFLWEPILNETEYPEDFAKNAADFVKEEFPYPSCYAACDNWLEGEEYYDVQYANPNLVKYAPGFQLVPAPPDPTKTYFSREWGENVDNYGAQNANNRVSMDWGEGPMLTQAQVLAEPPYKFLWGSYNAFYAASRQFAGGALWHAFDHQRGYHNDPFYGGLMDAFRMPKYAYYMFMSQREPGESDLIAETGPMVYVANAMTPFSPQDVTVYSNCDEVRLTVAGEEEPRVYVNPRTENKLPSPVITFPGAYSFMKNKAYLSSRKDGEAYMAAEGLMDGKVVATQKVFPAGRGVKVKMWVDQTSTALTANGSDVVTVVAAIVDDEGNIRRLNDDYISFTVEGEGRILGGADVQANPCKTSWGLAPVLIQSTTVPGGIKVTASVTHDGVQRPVSGEVVINSVPDTTPAIYDRTEAAAIGSGTANESGNGSANRTELEREIERLTKELNIHKANQVAKDQHKFLE